MWAKKRHLISFFLLKRLLRPWTKFRYNYKPIVCKEKGPFLIIGNHSIAHDPYLYSLLFKGRIYFLTTDELFRMGTFSKFVKYAVAPIPTRKSTKDTTAVKTVLSVAKQNKNICIYPEGATTYCGEQSYVDPTIVKLAKKINYKIAIVNIEGGFQSYPKFATKMRKGQMTGYIKKIITPDVYQNMSNEELYDVIVNNIKVPLLNVDFKCKVPAEYLETTIYYCNKCNTFENFISNKNTFVCSNCNTKYKVDLALNLHCEDTTTSIAKLYKIQEEKINSLSKDDIKNLVYTDKISLYEIVNYKKIHLVDATMILKDNVITIGAFSFSLDDIQTCATTGNHFLDIYINNTIYQIKGDCRFSNLKYMNIIFRYRNLVCNNDSKFLGI